MMIHDVNRGITKHKKKKRVGRGPGSGHGRYSGRGNKGQGQLAGWSTLPVFEGGRMPIYRRLPKRGFNNKFALRVATINLGTLQQFFDAGATVDADSLEKAGVLKERFDVIKILSEGEFTKKLVIKAHRFSAQAKAKIEQAGGTAELVPGPAPVVRNKMKSATK